MVKKILIADDSNNWLDYHQSVLKEVYGAEFAVSTANSARMAYDMVYNNLKEPYILIISDLQMELDFEPKYAGEWLIEQIHKLKEYKNTNIIIISATYNIKSIAAKLGVNYLPKAAAATNLTTYKLIMKKLIKDE